MAQETDKKDIETAKAELENEKLSEIFSNDVEDFGEIDDDADAIDGEIVDEVTEETKKPVNVQTSEPEVKDDFSKFIDTLPPNSDAKIIISRKPDHNLKFRIPCNTFGHIETMYWEGKSAPEIYDELKDRNGGGRYQLQLRQGTGLGKCWEVTILDPPYPSDREKQIIAEKEKAKQDELQRTAETSQVFTENPTTQKKELSPIKELLKDIEDIERLKAVLAPPQPPQPANNNSMAFDEMLMMKLLEKGNDNGELLSKVTDYAFGVFDKKKKEPPVNLASVIQEAIKNPEQTEGFLNTIVRVGGSLFVRSPQTPPQMPVVNLPNNPPNPPPITNPQTEPPKAEDQPKQKQPAIKPLKKVKW